MEFKCLGLLGDVNLIANDDFEDMINTITFEHPMVSYLKSQMRINEGIYRELIKPQMNKPESKANNELDV
jgi:hypothetical protein